MKKTLSTVLLLALTFFTVAAQSGAKFQFKDKNDTYDFGTVKEGTDVVHEYQFKNSGDQPLQILRVDASCGCTTPEWPKTPIMPGKSGKIKVTFKSQGRVGPVNRDITIQSNAVPQDKSKERHVLTLKGTVTK